MRRVNFNSNHLLRTILYVVSKKQFCDNFILKLFYSNKILNSLNYSNRVQSTSVVYMFVKP